MPVLFGTCVYVALHKLSGIYAVWQLASEMKSERDRLRKKGFLFIRKGGRGDAGGRKQMGSDGVTL